MISASATLCLVLWTVGGDDALRIRPAEDGRRIAVVARLSDDALAALPKEIDQQSGERWLRLCLIGEAGKPGPPLFGTYRREGEALVFRPRHRLAPGLEYRALLTVSPEKHTSRDYRVPVRATGRPPIVERVYPTSAVLPANQLKFYIHFSRPMREGREIFDQIQLVDDREQPVRGPWRRVELWSPDARRLTLWVHPGRVKQGVNLREEFGPALAPNRAYSLVIESDVRDADGQRLARVHTKRFTTAPADHRRPLPQDWKLTAPRANSRDPLRIEFSEPLDHALLFRFLEVYDSVGQKLAGDIAVGADESTWSFTPRQPWGSTSYTLKVESTLEDLAGNTPTRVFDTDLTKPAGPPPKLSLPFRPKAQ